MKTYPVVSSLLKTNRVRPLRRLHCVCIMHLHLHDMLANVVLSPAQLEGSLFIWKKRVAAISFVLKEICFGGMVK